ncbi:MAG TPA: flagellar motor switch phosphatase FliY, partial [Candidatus Moranbacteria bacterium]|nr:flagellar motor switch phosphatase FliY [Candidatus Moranbacteria bacterium]
LEEGSLLELNRPADENVTLLANGAPFARGEIVVINERFGVRLTSFMHEKRE